MPFNFEIFYECHLRQLRLLQVQFHTSFLLKKKTTVSAHNSCVTKKTILLNLLTSLRKNFHEEILIRCSNGRCRFFSLIINEETINLLISQNEFL